MRRWLAGMLAVTGCNQIFNIQETVLVDGGIGGGDDIDLDGVPDSTDPCLAAAQDLITDYDFDGVVNRDDTCPMDEAQDPTDTDRDGIPDTCDPFPATSGDVQRCFMRFTNSDLNARLWRERGTTMAWDLPSGMLRTQNDSTASLVSTHVLDGAGQPTLDVGLIINGDNTTLRGFQVWARAADEFRQDDVGCQMYGKNDYTQLAIILGGGGDVAQTSQMLAFPTGVGMRIRITYTMDASGPNIACTASWGFERWTVKATWPLPPGHIGFGADTAAVIVSGLTIYDRASAIPLP